MVPSTAEAIIGGEKELKKTGGWINGMASVLSKKKDIKLAIAATTSSVNDITEIDNNNIKYYAIPTSHANTQKPWIKVNESFKPDVVHIHGTEYSHATTWIKSNGTLNTVVSLQGIMSSCAKYYYYGMSQWDVIKNITLRDLIKGTIFTDARKFSRLAKSERLILQNISHVIGRTSWDHKQVWAINSKACYHFNNEILREDFYGMYEWKYSTCKIHSIFINQSAVPYKGFHILLKAMPLILSRYPDTTISVAGFNICDMSFKRKLMRTGYGKYIKGLIKKMHLEKCISFKGPLNAFEMIEEYMKANVFVLPSSIENSSNALGEAQILGVPCIASRVGGMENLIPNDNCGMLYRFSDIVELAYAICHTFETSPSFNNTIMRTTANMRHDRNVNADTLIAIYHKIKEQQWK